MAQIVVILFVFVVTASASSVPTMESESNPITEAYIEARYYGKGGSTDPLVRKVTCAMDVNGAIASEYGAQALWIETQAKILKNTNNIFGCMNYEGFVSTT